MKSNVIAAIAILMVGFLIIGIGCGPKPAPEPEPIPEPPPPPPDTTVQEPEPPPPPPKVVITEDQFQIAFFDFDKYNLKTEAREALEFNARILKENPDVKVLIEGHCDERGTVEYNLALGEKRARAAMEYITSLGVAADRLDIVSYGKERPVALGHDENSWSKNRRAKFTITEQ